MKIVSFAANNGLRLGVVDGDTVIDLQAVDANLPGDLGGFERLLLDSLPLACGG